MMWLGCGGLIVGVGGGDVVGGGGWVGVGVGGVGNFRRGGFGADARGSGFVAFDVAGKCVFGIGVFFFDGRCGVLDDVCVEDFFEYGDVFGCV